MGSGHKNIKKKVIEDLKLDTTKRIGPYYYRRIHIFYKNECIMEIDLTGYLHQIQPLANIGEISFHIDDPYDNFEANPKKKKRKRRRKK